MPTIKGPVKLGKNMDDASRKKLSPYLSFNKEKSKEAKKNE